MRFLLVPLVAICAYADSITVEVMPGRQAIVQERYALPGPAELVYLSSPCMRVAKIRTTDGRALEATGSGPWITVAAPAEAVVDLSYEAVPVSPSPQTCAVPLLMPKHAIQSVSVSVIDRGSRLRDITVPHLVAQPASGKWTATFPAVPSRLQLDWETGNAPPAAPSQPAGLFFWNFWGLTGVLVVWASAYLVWARRQAS